jgi:heptosyltransferase-1
MILSQKLSGRNDRMRVLVIKTSSLGDVIHTLPAITDAIFSREDLQIDWVVEEAFSEIPEMHPAIDTVIQVSIRRWRNSWVKNLRELFAFVRRLRSQRYDLVIDGQGLVKSALIAWLAKGPVAGLDKLSAREGVVSKLYLDKLYVSRSMHAVERLRTLFAYSLGYEMSDSLPVFGLLRNRPQKKQIFFLHGTTWESKLWPVDYWRQLALLCAEDYEVVLTFGDRAEHERAKQISGDIEHALILPAMGLSEIADVIAESAGVVAVDTGLGHLANALGKPLVALYGATNPELTGPCGINQNVIVNSSLACVPCLRRECKYAPGEISDIHPPCFSDLTPKRVFDSLQDLISSTRGSE